VRVNGTRACIHAEIMEINGDDLRGEARRTSGNGETGGRKGLEGIGVHRRFRMERGNGHLSFVSVLFFHLHFRTSADFS